MDVLSLTGVHPGGEPLHDGGLDDVWYDRIKPKISFTECDEGQPRMPPGVMGVVIDAAEALKLDLLQDKGSDGCCVPTGSDVCMGLGVAMVTDCP